MLDSSIIVYYTEMDSPIGHLTLATTAKGLCWIYFEKSVNSLNSLKIWSKRWIGTEKIEPAKDELDDAVKQLKEYFAGKRKEFDLKIDLYGTPFQKLVWDSLLTIPYGEIRTYKDIAIQINAPKAVRAIGGANHNNPISIIVPCHRVIGTNGNLVGYGGGLDVKRHLLDLEGYTKK